MTHGIEVEERLVEGRAKFRAQCKCGWKGHVKKVYATAVTDGTLHMTAHALDLEPLEPPRPHQPRQDHEVQVEVQERATAGEDQIRSHMIGTARWIVGELEQPGTPKYLEIARQARLILEECLRRSYG